MKSSLMSSAFIIVLFCSFSNCSQKLNGDAVSSKTEKPDKAYDGFAKAYFASGCFWCVEAIFESVKGVEEAISGYAGGEEKNPTYRDVSAGITGHTETVEVIYDASKIDYATLLKVYYGSHNPSTVDGQHPDYGKQYRSAIFYLNEDEKKTFRLHLIYSILDGIVIGILALNEFVFIKSIKGSDYQLGFLFQFSVLVFVFLIFFTS